MLKPEVTESPHKTRKAGIGFRAEASRICVIQWAIHHVGIKSGLSTTKPSSNSSTLWWRPARASRPRNPRAGHADSRTKPAHREGPQ